MKNNKANYRFDFVIPVGPTGPTGPQGIEGITGPTGPASLSALLFTEFYSSNKNNNLSISKNTILPENSNIFTIQNSEIEINEPGNYEVTVSGVISGLTPKEVLSINMVVTNVVNNNRYNVILASIIADAKQEYFSQTMLMTLQERQKINLLFRKDDFYPSAIETVTLCIKKLSF